MMRSFIHYSGLFFLFLMVLSSCRTKNIQCSNREVYFQQLSAEVESPRQNNPVVIQEEKIISANHENASQKNNSLSRPIQISKKEKTKILKIKVTPPGSVKKANGWTQSDIDKDNIFWKIGKVMLKIGTVILSIFGGVFISVNRSSGGIFVFSGVLFGLAVIILSLPFFLLALISTHMKRKRESRPPVENPDEI